LQFFGLLVTICVGLVAVFGALTYLPISIVTLQVLVNVIAFVLAQSGY